jgi:chorismate mutase
MGKREDNEREEKRLWVLDGSLAAADADLVLLLARRMELVVKVAHCKMRSGKPILREEIEKRRVARMVELATKAGLSPEFMRAIYYMVIAESCRVQIRTKEEGK